VRLFILSWQSKRFPNVQILNTSPIFSHLPAENWNDVFDFLTRLQLAQIVPQIGDWHFAGKAQYYLHECGQITFGQLEIISSRNGHGAVIRKRFFFGREFPLADASMPENVKNFKILIRFL
jgi:hypothetical protein